MKHPIDKMIISRKFFDENKQRVTNYIQKFLDNKISLCNNVKIEGFDVF